MKHYKMLAITFAIALTATTQAIGAAADLASFPVKPVRLIIPYAPGGTNDVLGRIVAPHMGEGLRQSVIMAGKSLRYWYERPALDSPWYQMAPLIAKGTRGAIIPLYSSAGFHPGGLSFPSAEAWARRSAAS